MFFSGPLPLCKQGVEMDLCIIVSVIENGCRSLKKVARWYSGRGSVSVVSVVVSGVVVVVVVVVLVVLIEVLFLLLPVFVSCLGNEFEWNTCSDSGATLGKCTYKCKLCHV